MTQAAAAAAPHLRRPGLPILHRPGAGALAALGVACSLLLAAAPPASAEPKSPSEARAAADDLLVVDCLLPNKVRRLGRNSTYLAPRQPIRTTAADCRIRGGEYTEPDQVTYAT
ncbi:MAG: hypothetical protein AAF725_13505 [Acidobacteriota bacterium]